MNISELSFLADENIHPGLIEYLITNKIDIKTVHELGLAGLNDKKILETAITLNRIIITHDSDFGSLVILKEIPFPGIIFLRPGHINKEFSIKIWKFLETQKFDVENSFIIVARRKDDEITIRVRQLF